MWRRLCALNSAGADIFLLFWTGDAAHETPNGATLQRLGEKASAVRYFVIPRTARERIRRLMRLSRWPSHVGSRVLNHSQYARLISEIRPFSADAIWLDGIYGGVLARRLGDDLNIPFFCRSHNIEHIYMKEQIAKATEKRDKLAWQLNIPHLQRFEQETLAHACRFFDISSDDLQYWKDHGLSNGEWLPPTIDAAFAQAAGQPPWAPAFDVGYIGNLYTPNNVDGVAWFVEQVLPELRLKRPEIRVFVAGASPAARIVALAQQSQIILAPDPPDVLPWFRNAKVLINPLRAGSGMNIKSVEMLFSPAQLVSTPQGLAGLPAEARGCFTSAENAHDFAAAVDQALETEDTAAQAARRIEARTYFSPEKAAALLKCLVDETKQWHAAPGRANGNPE